MSCVNRLVVGSSLGCLRPSLKQPCDNFPKRRCNAGSSPAAVILQRESTLSIRLHHHNRVTLGTSIHDRLIYYCRQCPRVELGGSRFKQFDSFGVELGCGYPSGQQTLILGRRVNHDTEVSVKQIINGGRMVRHRNTD